MRIRGRHESPMVTTRRRPMVAVAASVLLGVFLVTGGASTTIVRGQQGRWDVDNNGYPDAGVTVTGKYTSVYAYDTEDWYWDLGDGRVEGSVGSIDDLDQEALTTCLYQVAYRGNFENDPFLDSGWIINAINCSGFDDNGTYNSLIVHQTDPRYTGNPDLAIWGTWEYHVQTESGVGNLVRPHGPIGTS